MKCITTIFHKIWTDGARPKPERRKKKFNDFIIQFPEWKFFAHTAQQRSAPRWVLAVVAYSIRVLIAA